MNHSDDRTLKFRGSVSDLATDVRAALTPDQVSELAFLLSSPPANPDADGFFYWVIRVGIHRVWVEDGADVTDERALEMLGRARIVVQSLLRDALATVDPASSDELVARQVTGYVLRNSGRLDTLRGGLVLPPDLTGLVVTVSHPPEVGVRRVAVNFAQCRVRPHLNLGGDECAVHWLPIVPKRARDLQTHLHPVFGRVVDHGLCGLGCADCGYDAHLGDCLTHTCRTCGVGCAPSGCSLHPSPPIAHWSPRSP